VIFLDDRSIKLSKIAAAYYDEIYKYCRRRVRTDDDAYDLTQEIFLALSGSFEKINAESIRKWLYVTAHNKIVDYYKSRKIETDNRIFIDISDDTVKLFEDFTENIEENELHKFKDEIEKSLTEDEYSLYRSVFFEKKRVAALVSELNITETAARKRISRLSNKIRKLIKALLYSAICLLTRICR
jgi:RNA polymerase sigma factor (sigma-70 family)